jgi:twinkle protein
MSDSKELYRDSCEECGSPKGKVHYDDGHWYCFACELFGNEEGENPMPVQQAPIKGVINNVLSKGVSEPLTDRNLSLETVKKYGVTVVNNKHIYPYFDKDSCHVANKVRQTNPKNFFVEGDLGASQLFGQSLFSPQSARYITVCEGEIDAMSVFELTGSKYPCVSIKSGAASALRDCKHNFEYLNTFDNVILCFDNDDAGRRASEKVAELFEPHKCKIIKLAFKDANEYLKIGKREDFSRAWWSAEPYTPAGIINLRDIGSKLYEEDFCDTCPYPWEGLNEKLYGMRTGELVTFTSGSGMGKSSIIRELMHHILNKTEDNIGILALEENVRNTAFNIMSVEANARLYIKEIRDQYNREQLNDWEKATLGTGRLFAFDHFGSITNDEILGRIRYMARALDCKWIMLDHLSILVSGQEEFGDERKSIDVLMTKLRSLVEETGVALLLVSHLRRRTGDKGFEEGKEVTLSHLRGSASIGHLSDAVIALERNQQSEDETEANTNVIRILKNRYTGDTGVAEHLYYDKETGRMSAIENPFVAERHTTEDDDDLPFEV